MSKCKNCIHNEWITEDGRRFHWCTIHNDNFGDGNEERFCGTFKSITNGDRIRSMTDEELVEFITAHARSCFRCAYRYESCCSQDCTTGVLEWLKKEVEG